MNDPIVMWMMVAGMVVLAVVTHFMYRSVGDNQRERAYRRVPVENKDYFRNRGNR